MAALWFVLYRPMLKFMRERDKRIQEGKKAGIEAEEMLRSVKEECKKAKEEAELDAKEQLETARRKAKEEAERAFADRCLEVKREYSAKLETLSEENRSKEAYLAGKLDLITGMIADKVTGEGA